jgi:hypothetical protein
MKVSGAWQGRRARKVAVANPERFDLQVFKRKQQSAELKLGIPHKATTTTTIRDRKTYCAEIDDLLDVVLVRLRPRTRRPARVPEHELALQTRSQNSLSQNPLVQSHHTIYHAQR